MFKFSIGVIFIVFISIAAGCYANKYEYTQKLPKEISQEDLSSMLSLIPKHLDQSPYAINFYSYNAPKIIKKKVFVTDFKTKEAKEVVEEFPEWIGKYGVRISFGSNDCSELTVFVFTKDDEADWRLYEELIEFPAINCKP